MKCKLDLLNLDIKVVFVELDFGSYGFFEFDMDWEFNVGVEIMVGLLGGN